MGRVDGSEPRTCEHCGKTSEEFYFLLQHSRVCSALKQTWMDALAACEGLLKGGRKYGEKVILDKQLVELTLQQLVDARLGIIVKTPPVPAFTPGPCKECAGTGEIGLADGDVPCPKCFGSGDPDKPGIFKGLV